VFVQTKPNKILKTCLEEVEAPSKDRRQRPDPVCQVCLGGRILDDEDKDIFEMISSFWQTKFHEDWLSLSRELKAIKSFLIWSEKTQEDPSFITKVKWPIKAKIIDFPKLRYEQYCCIRSA